MDIFDLIEQEHRQIEKLLLEVENADSTQKLYECFNQLYEEINLHTQAEVKIFYPEISKYGDNDAIVETAKKEHEELMELLEEVESLSPTSEEFKSKIKQLKYTFQHHLQEEENLLFDKLNQYINEQERIQLGKSFAAIKSQFQIDN